MKVQRKLMTFDVISRVDEIFFHFFSLILSRLCIQSDLS